MGSLYRRAKSRFWWLIYTNAKGERVWASSGTEDRAKAKQTLAALEKAAAAQKATGVIDPTNLTVRRYAEEIWLPQREKRGVVTWKDDKGRLAHAYPFVGHLPLEKVEREDVVRMVRALSEPSKDRLSNRTIRHVYEALRVLFKDARKDRLVTETPCDLEERRGELPPKTDADPLFRINAVFTREEVERIISADELPERHRVLYALLFLTGMRIGEATARRWRDLDMGIQPLGRLLVPTQWRRKGNQEAPTKTKTVRTVPVHPTLARMLAAWRLAGWEKSEGRRPEPEDFIVPGRLMGRPLNSNATLAMFHKDLGELGLRERRQHDTRRTFITLARANGAVTEFVKWITHGPSGSVMDAYTTPPWEVLCETVTKVPVRMLTGDLLRYTNRGT